MNETSPKILYMQNSRKYKQICSDTKQISSCMEMRVRGTRKGRITKTHKEL